MQKNNIFEKKISQEKYHDVILDSKLKLRKDTINRDLFTKRLKEIQTKNIENQKYLNIDQHRFDLLTSEDKKIKYDTLCKLLATYDNQNIIDCLYYINTTIFVRAPNHIFKRMFVQQQFVDLIYNIFLKNKDIQIFNLLLSSFIVLIGEYIDIRRNLNFKEFITQLLIKLNKNFINDNNSVGITLQLIETIFHSYKFDEFNYLDLQLKNLLMEFLIYILKSKLFNENDNIKMLIFFNMSLILEIELNGNDYNLFNLKDNLYLIIEFPIKYSRRKNNIALYYNFHVLFYLSKNHEMKKLLFENNITNTIFQCFEYLFFNQDTSEEKKNFSIPLTENYFMFINEIILNLIEYFIEREEFFKIYLKLIENYRFQMRVQNIEDNEKKNDSIYILLIIYGITNYSNNLIENFLKNEKFLKYIIKFYTKNSECFQIILKILINIFKIHLNKIEDFPMFGQIDFYNIISSGLDFNIIEIQINTIEMLEELIQLNLEKNIVNLVNLYKNSLIYDKLSKLMINDNNKNINLLNKSNELFNYLEKNN